MASSLDHPSGVDGRRFPDSDFDNALDVLTAYVAIVDEQPDVVEGYKEFIHHEAQPAAESEE